MRRHHYVAWVFAVIMAAGALIEVGVATGVFPLAQPKPSPALNCGPEGVAPKVVHAAWYPETNQYLLIVQVCPLPPDAYRPPATYEPGEAPPGEP